MLLFLTGASVALAQTAAKDSTPRPIDVPAGLLDEALAAIGRAFDIDVIVAGELVAGKRSPRVAGTMGAEQALSRALIGSGLVVERTPDGAFVVVVAPDAASEPAEVPGDANATLDERFVETIVVTGTKQDRTLQETAVSVELFDSERLAREVALSLDDVFDRAPNVATAGFTGGLSIRGISRGGVGGAGTGVTSNIYMDGAPISTTSANSLQSLWDVEQVEILRGPQSTVQGRNALAGAIVVNTRDPSDEFELAGQLLYGDLGSAQYSAVVSGPIVRDQLAFRLSADYLDYDGDIVNATTGADQNPEGSTTLRGKLLYEPLAVPGLRVDLQFDYADTFQGRFSIADPPAPLGDPAFEAFDPFGGVSFGFPDRSDYEVIRPVLRVDTEISDMLTLTAIATYEDVRADREIGDLSDPTRFDTTAGAVNESETASGELRLNFDFGRWTGWAGVYYFDEQFTQESVAVLPFTLLGLPVVPPDSLASLAGVFATDTQNFALFGEARFEMNERWHFEFGLRYDDEEFSNDGSETIVTVEPADCAVNPAVPNVGGLPCVFVLAQPPQPPQSASFDALLPRGTVTYRFDDRRSLSLGIQRGYRAGGSFLATTIEAGQPVTAIGQFDPEFITNYELSLRTAWLDDRLIANVNVFYARWEDQQIQIPGPSGLPQDSVVVNAGESEFYGAEAMLDYALSDELSLFLSLGLIETEFTDFPFAVDANGDPVNLSDPTFANLAGNEFPVSPSITASAGAYYQHASGFFADTTLSYTGEYFSGVENLDVNRAGDFTLVNGRVGYRTAAVEIYLFAENLFDSRAITEQSLVAVPAASGIETVETGPLIRVNRPRVYGIGLSFSM